MLLRSIYVLVAPVMLVFAALACGTIVTDTASYTCPTAIPQPTSTVLAGTPEPTLAPPPTPYTLAPPQDFYVGDAVFVGQPGAPLRLRFRLQNVQVQPAGSDNLVTWRLEIRNLGSATYETVPVALMVITRITTANGDQTGIWRTSEAAMTAAGFTNENYDPLPARRDASLPVSSVYPQLGTSASSPTCWTATAATASPGPTRAIPTAPATWRIKEETHA